MKFSSQLFTMLSISQCISVTVKNLKVTKKLQPNQFTTRQFTTQNIRQVCLQNKTKTL